MVTRTGKGDSPMNGSKCPGYKFLQSVQFAICCTKHIQKISKAGSIYVMPVHACPKTRKQTITNHYLKCPVKQTKHWQQQQQQQQQHQTLHNPNLTRNSNIGCLGIKCAKYRAKTRLLWAASSDDWWKILLFMAELLHHLGCINPWKY